MAIVREIQPAESADWNRFVRSQPRGVFTQLYEWAVVIGRAYELETLHLAAFADDKIVAVLPLAIVRSPLRDPLAVSLPYSGYAGMLVAEGIDRDEALAAFRTSMAEHDISKIELRQLADSSEVASSETTLRLRLPESSDALWKQLDAKVRNLVRKAERSGLLVQWGLEQMDDFYYVHARNMSHLGTPPHSRKLFAEISSELKGSVDVLTVRKEGDVIAAMIVTKMRKQLAGPWASSLHQYSSFSPNMLLYWEVLRYGCENGYAEYDFGRSQVGSGTYNFKKQWGASPIPIENLRIGVDGTRRPSSMDFYRGKSAGILSEVWKLIPFPISIWLGPKLRKYLP